MACIRRSIIMLHTLTYRVAGWYATFINLQSGGLYVSLSPVANDRCMLFRSNILSRLEGVAAVKVMLLTVCVCW